MKRWKNDFPVEKLLMEAKHRNELLTECKTGEQQKFFLDSAMNLETVYPQEIAEWFAQLKLLKGVPLSYLVGDEKQLPPESIRFFYLDENWTYQMTGGALSIGAGNRKANTVNDFYMTDFDVMGKESICHPRKNHIHQKQKQFYYNRVRRRRQTEETGEITGFIMRSQLVKLWKGLESTATDRQGNPLVILRMEQLSEEIMLCLYQGEIAKLRIKEPKEGLRFGTHENDRTIHVREVKKGNEGVLIPGATVQIQTNSYGRADILSLAENLRSKTGAGRIGSAELAMELIIAPGLAEFSRN